LGRGCRGREKKEKDVDLTSGHRKGGGEGQDRGSASRIPGEKPGGKGLSIISKKGYLIRLAKRREGRSSSLIRRKEKDEDPKKEADDCLREVKGSS